MKEKQTPLLKQYGQIKVKYPDTILFFRMGDFFETFDDDAVITSKVCGITLTKRNNGGAAETPLAGFPHHQLDVYLPKMVKAGYRVAVCEQLEDPKFAKGIVKRDVIEVVTPGVALYDRLLDSKTNNYLAAVYFKTEKNGFLNIGYSSVDISTGEFFTTELQGNQLVNILESFSPNEILIAKNQKKIFEDYTQNLSFKPAITKMEDWIFDYEFASEGIKHQFNTQSLKGFGIDGLTSGIIATGAVLNYIKETQKIRLEYLKNISLYNYHDFMMLDYATRRNLEITFSSNANTSEGSLISIMDKTLTAMGGRLFKKWITRPLLKVDKINARLDSVEYFVDNSDYLELLRSQLFKIQDLERLISKICTGRANPRDIIALKQSLQIIPEIKSGGHDISVEVLKNALNKLADFSGLIKLISDAIVDEPSTIIGSGNIFKHGYSAELDKYIDAKYSGKSWISDYQEAERQKSGINTLKVGFNNVFGYYIEITKSNNSKAPEYYERKQTLTNAERYTTPELKEIESTILSAEEKISELESALFNELRMKIAVDTTVIQNTANILSMIDCLQSFAKASIEYNYTKPLINDSLDLNFKTARHPVVERLLKIGDNFTPNDTNFNQNSLIHIITGPNMAGKSCYLRQTALIVLLGQIGCFVPAEKAEFGIIDRIFTRVGAQDNISSGESTFLVEMQEAANILNNATSKSLILLDEVGRGTATFDGISIAWAISEYIHNCLNAKTLFATHYHELNDLSNMYDKIQNYQVEVIEQGDKVIFTHKVKEGGADHSFGIYVAKMAGLPKQIITRANEIMNLLEGKVENTDTPEIMNDLKNNAINTSKIKKSVKKQIPEQLSFFEFRDDKLREQIRGLDINNITPMQALQILSDLYKESLN